MQQQQHPPQAVSTAPGAFRLYGQPLLGAQDHLGQKRKAGEPGSADMPEVGCWLVESVASTCCHPTEAGAGVPEVRWWLVKAGPLTFVVPDMCASCMHMIGFSSAVCLVAGGDMLKVLAVRQQDGRGLHADARQKREWQSCPGQES